MRYRIREAQQSLNKYSLEIIPRYLAAETVSVFRKDPNELKKEIIQNSLHCLRGVYQLSCQLLNQSLLFNEQNRLELLQNAIDSGFELALLESESTEYLSLLEQLQVIIDELYRLVSQDQWKYIHYYQFKLFEFTAIYYEHHLPDPWNTNESYREREMDGNLYSSYPYSSDLTLAKQAYEQAYHIWLTNAIDHQYFGNGNGLLTHYKEGVRTIKHLISLSCWYESQRFSPQVESWVVDAHCLLSVLVKEVGLDLSSFSSEFELCIERSKSRSIVETIPEMLTISESVRQEYTEVFLLSIPCMKRDGEQEGYDSVDAALQVWKLQLFGDVSLVSLLEFLHIQLSIKSLSTQYDMLTPRLLSLLSTKIARDENGLLSSSFREIGKKQEVKKFRRLKKTDHER